MFKFLFLIGLITVAVYFFTSANSLADKSKKVDKPIQNISLSKKSAAIDLDRAVARKAALADMQKSENIIIRSKRD